MIKNLPVNAGDIRVAGSIPGSGRSLGGGHGNPLHYSCHFGIISKSLCSMNLGISVLFVTYLLGNTCRNFSDVPIVPFSPITV